MAKKLSSYENGESVIFRQKKIKNLKKKCTRGILIMNYSAEFHWNQSIRRYIQIRETEEVHVAKTAIFREKIKIFKKYTRGICIMNECANFIGIEAFVDTLKSGELKSRENNNVKNYL